MAAAATAVVMQECTLTLRYCVVTTVLLHYREVVRPLPFFFQTAPDLVVSVWRRARGFGSPGIAAFCCKT
jgi:hypothetical protein